MIGRISLKVQWRRVSVVLIIAGAVAPPYVVAGNIQNCEKERIRFDGLSPIHYVTVLGDKTSRIYLHRDYPSRCSSADDASCTNSAYVLPGEELAVGKICGDWAYVQYIGEKHVTLGWIASKRLLSGTPVQGGGSELIGQHARDQRFSFALKNGHGLPVCEAYLQRLNTAVYDLPPYCDRPESEVVPGFKLLKRMPLEPDEVVSMSGSLHKRWVQPNPHLSGSWAASADWVGGEIKAWRYASTIDLSNDGEPQQVLVWQGYGLSGGLLCGRKWNNNSWGYRPRQLPLVLQADNRYINERKTAVIFGGRGHPNWVAHSPWVPPDSAFPFRPLGRSIGIFEYRGVVYFDTFFDLTGDDLGRRAGQAKLANTLGVFLRKQGKTSEICEYDMAGHDYSTVEEAE